MVYISGNLLLLGDIRLALALLYSFLVYRAYSGITTLSTTSSIVYLVAHQRLLFHHLISHLPLSFVPNIDFVSNYEFIDDINNNSKLFCLWSHVLLYRFVRNIVFIRQWSNWPITR